MQNPKRLNGYPYTISKYCPEDDAVQVEEIGEQHYKGMEVFIWEYCFAPLIESREQFKEVSYEKVFKELVSPVRCRS